jgi:hypothetical protein
MPLQNTLDLLSQYGQKLIDNSITDDELKQLMDGGSFKQHGNPASNAKQFYSDADHTTTHAMLDFVGSIGPFLNKDQVEQLVTRCLDLSDQSNPTQYMRNATLEKCFLSYELAVHPQTNSVRFLKGEFLYNIFETSQNIKNLQDTILKQNILFYEKEPKSPCTHAPYETASDYPRGADDWSAKLAIRISALPDENYKQQARTFLKTAHELIRKDQENATLAKEAIEKTVALMYNEINPEDYTNYVSGMQAKNHSSPGVQILGAIMLVLAKSALMIVTIATLGQAKQTMKTLEFNTDKYRHRVFTGRNEKNIYDDMEAVSKAKQSNPSPSSNP